LGPTQASRNDISSHVANALITRQLPGQSAASATHIDDKMSAA
jgi:hypothetical protein